MRNIITPFYLLEKVGYEERRMLERERQQSRAMSL